MSAYCVVRLDGSLEIGRTQTVPDSSEPLWAATFAVCRSQQVGDDPLRERSKGQTARSSSAPPRSVEDARSRSLDAILEIWDDDPVNGPFRLGAATLPYSATADFLATADNLHAADPPAASSSASGGRAGGNGGDDESASRSPGSGSRRLIKFLTLEIATPIEEPIEVNAPEAEGLASRDSVGRLTISVEKVQRSNVPPEAREGAARVGAREFNRTDDDAFLRRSIESSSLGRLGGLGVALRKASHVSPLDMMAPRCIGDLVFCRVINNFAVVFRLVQPEAWIDVDDTMADPDPVDMHLHQSSFVL